MVPRYDAQRFDGDVVELELLVTSQHARQLEEAAARRGETLGQLLRNLVRDYLRAPFPVRGISSRRAADCS
jgi:hypothetical protein